ncbi:glycosyltransferase family 87 protein [Streptomyces barringtoniae]|uniref:glycosyltransferase family 87 protein n=1 Tax=Streptomyces barringtoniae TaxID=2892029 RepID=UPI0027E25352|nr:glycosyltransferase family 87 protein [Streptomyces barringtoniae]
MRGPRTTRSRLLLVLVLGAAVTVFTATVPLLRDFFDLRVYYGTVHTWAHHGGRIYDYQVPGTSYGFTYPPFAALAMLPLALVDRTSAIAASLLVNLAALAVVLRILAGPDWRRHGWYRWSLGLCLLALFEPLRDTFSFGQVNLVLLALVLGDCLLLATGRERWAGAGIGLAAAVKLTPALFIGLLLLAGRRRAAGVATAVAAVATALAAWADPRASRFYWTQALWDTGRVGRLDYVSNQSLQGVLARLGEPGRPLWATAVLLTLCVWAWRARRAVRAGDWTAAFALTGAAACLVSPITWVHHLVWLLPSFAVLLRAGHPRIAGALYAVLCTSVVWLWFDDASGIGGFLGSNTYTWITLGLLLGLPTGQPRGLRLPLARSTTTTAARSATTAAPATSPASPATTAGPGQPERSAGACDVAAATGLAGDTGRDLTRSPSSEPTGSTRPAAAKPQSSSSRASWYTANPPPF